MDTILSDHSISMSDFKKNPARIVRESGGSPVAVLSHNKPAFYMVSPELFEVLVEELADREIEDLARRRLKRKNTAVDVDIESL
jgi:antitoxin StbD